MIFSGFLVTCPNLSILLSVPRLIVISFEEWKWTGCFSPRIPPNQVPFNLGEI